MTSKILRAVGVLARRGPGLHHVAYQVRDIEAALSGLRGQGVRLIDQAPRTGIRGIFGKLFQGMR